MVCNPDDTLLKKSNFSFVRSCQLEITSEIEMGVHVHFPRHHWDPMWHRLMWALCYLTQVLWVCMYVGPVVSRRYWFLFVCLFWCLPSSVAITIFLPPLSHSSLSPKRRNWMKTSHLCLCFLRFLILCVFLSCVSLHLFLSTLGRSFSGDGWARHWSISTAEYS